MSGGIASLIVDGIVLLLLGTTIFFSARLSLHLRVFRESRGALEKLISDLSSHIDRADKAIAGLKASAHEAAKGLQEQLDDAQALCDELQIMTESGGRLASRLEQAVENRVGNSSSQEKLRRTLAEDTLPKDKGFFIRDPDYNEEEPDLKPSSEEKSPREGGGGLESQAERDLFDAIKSRRKTMAGAK